MQINLGNSIMRVKKYLDEVSRQQLPFATSKALTMTAVDVRTGLQQDMKNVFNKPTPYTLNSIYVKAASKKDLTARVGHKEFPSKGTPASYYLQPQVFGGERPLKRSERWLGEFWVPSRNAPVNQYGNMTNGKMTQILSVLGKNPDPMSNTTKRSRQRNRKLPEFFISRGGRLPAGIWQRYGRRSIKPILFFIKAPKYTPRYDFFGVSKKVVNEKFSQNFGTAMNDAIRTAR